MLSDEINLEGAQEKNYVLIFELSCLDCRNNLFLERQIQKVIDSVVPCDEVILFSQTQHSALETVGGFCVV